MWRVNHSMGWFALYSSLQIHSSLFLALIYATKLISVHCITQTPLPSTFFGVCLEEVVSWDQRTSPSSTQSHQDLPFWASVALCPSLTYVRVVMALAPCFTDPWMPHSLSWALSPVLISGLVYWVVSIHFLLERDLTYWSGFTIKPINYV